MAVEPDSRETLSRGPDTSGVPGRVLVNSDAADGSVRLAETAPPDPGDETLGPTIWGSYEAPGAGGTVAFFLRCRPRESPPAPGEEPGNPVDRFHLVLTGDRSEREKLIPGPDPGAFEQALVTFTLGDHPSPAVNRDVQRDALRRYLTEDRRDRLEGILREQREEDLTDWVGGLMKELLDDENHTYSVFAGWTGRPPVAESTSESPPEEPDPGTTDSTVDVNVVTDPSSGIPAPELETGDEVLVRIVGDDLEDLPDRLVDRDRSTPASVPLAGRVVSREAVTELPVGYDADPEDYDRLCVELRPGLTGDTLLFHGDRLKRVETGEDQNSDDGGVQPDVDHLVLGLLLALLFLVFVVLIFL